MGSRKRQRKYEQKLYSTENKYKIDYYIPEINQSRPERYRASNQIPQIRHNNKDYDLESYQKLALAVIFNAMREAAGLGVKNSSYQARIDPKTFRGEAREWLTTPSASLKYWLDILNLDMKKFIRKIKESKFDFRDNMYVRSKRRCPF